MSGGVIDLSCPKCGSNRMRFPVDLDDPLICEDCGTAGISLRDAQELIATGAHDRQETAQPAGRAERRMRHTSEVEASQAELRESVAETDRLVVASDKMLRRHRKECDDDEDNR